MAAYSHIMDVLRAIEATPSKNEKLDILESVKGTDIEQLFMKVSNYAYSSYYTYNILKYKKECFGAPPIYTLEECFSILELLNAGSLRGKDAVENVERLIRYMSKDDGEVFHRIIQGDFRCGITATSLNKVWPGLVYQHPYMRASVGDKKNLKKLRYPCIAETKMDGMYVDIVVATDRVDYMSRQGQFLPFNHEFRDQALMIEQTRLLGGYANGYVLMGEALVLDPNTGCFMSRQEGNGYLNQDNPDTSRIVFVVWDCVPLAHFHAGKTSIVGSERRDVVRGITKILPFIEEVEREICSSIEDVVDAFRDAVKRGEEGIIVKNYDILWKDGTSTDQFKLKCIAEGELVVEGINEGEGKYRGMVGSLRCSSACGKVKVNVGGIKDELRAKWFKKPDMVVGKIITARYNDVVSREDSETLSLYLPRFVEIRNDKNEADTLERLREQIEACVENIAMLLRM